MNKSLEYIFRFLPVLLWASVIYTLSEIPSPYDLLGTSPPAQSAFAIGSPTASRSIPPDNFLEDMHEAPDRAGWSAHLGEFAVFSYLIARAFIWRGRLKPGLLITSFLLSGLYGLLDEIHQIYVPGRSFELFDLGMDVVGALLGIAAYVFIKRRTPITG